MWRKIISSHVIFPWRKKLKCWQNGHSKLGTTRKIKEIIIGPRQFFSQFASWKRNHYQYFLKNFVDWWNYLMNSLRKCIVDLDGVESKDDAPDTSYYQVCKKFLSFYHRNLNFLFHPINHNGLLYFLSLHLKPYLYCLSFLVYHFKF